jgi:hypothetical protein
MAGVPARPYGTSALPELDPVLPADLVMSGARATGPVFRTDEQHLNYTAVAALQYRRFAQGERIPPDWRAGAPRYWRAPDWQAAMEALILVATHGGPTMFARIGIMRAPNHRHVREFDPDRKPHHW